MVVYGFLYTYRLTGMQSGARTVARYGFPRRCCCICTQNQYAALTFDALTYATLRDAAHAASCVESDGVRESVV